MSEPTIRGYTREEMREAVVAWMIEQYGKPKDLSEQSRERWHERCGMLYSFIFDHFPQ